MRGHFLAVAILIAFSYCFSMANTVEFFPTGMSWKEVVVSSHESFSSQTDSEFVYEIGSDTLIDMQYYKKVIKNGVMQPFWVREQENKVFLLTGEYTKELMLYDFNWDGETGFRIDYLVESVEDGTICATNYEVSPAFNVTFSDSPRYEFHNEGNGAFYGGTVIRGLGRVAEMYRNGCILGYKVYDVPLPTATVLKVLWVKRAGEYVFNSQEQNEWITVFPESAEYHYIPLVRDGVQWVFYHDNLFTGEAYDHVQEFIGTSVIGGKTYNTLCSHGLNDEPDKIHAVSLLREEGHRVYGFPVDPDFFPIIDPETGECLLYDFDDMTQTYNPEERDFIHFSRGYAEVDGQLRGAVFNQGASGFTVQYIEGIGSVHEGVLERIPVPSDGSQDGLSYVTENGRIVFKGPRYDDHLFYLQHGLSKFKCDLNGDNEVNVADISALYREIINQENPGIGIFDTNGDGEVNVADVSTLYNIILGQ